MLVSIILNNIQKTLQTTGVYRSSTFVMKGINEGMKLTSYLTFYDERKKSLSRVGTRNIVDLPSDGDAQMISPIYVSNGVSGNRVNPVRILDFELSDEQWEGVVDGADSLYYILLNPVHCLEMELLCSPIQNTGTVALDMVGAYVPGDVASGDTMDFPEQYAEVLYFYGMFYCYVSMPGMVEECLEAYKSYIRIVNLMVEDLASRFPSDQGVKPVPVEFNYDTVTRFNMDGRDRQKDEASVTQGA